MSNYDPEYQRKYQREKYYRWMAEARESLGGKCVICGTTENLQFDHIDPATKLFVLGQRRVRREIFDAEVAKCQLLCVEHHKEKTAREQRKDHGSWGMYRNRGCRCDICRSFISLEMRKYKGRDERSDNIYGGMGRYGTVDHGGGKTGKSGCKCDLCKAKKAEYARERRKK